MSALALDAPMARAHQDHFIPSTDNDALNPTHQTNSSEAQTAPQKGYFSRFAEALTLPAIKTLDHYLGQWRSADLQAPATTEHLLKLAETGSATLNAIANTNADPVQVWDATVDQLGDENQLLALNTVFNTLACSNKNPTQCGELLQKLPAAAQAYLTQQRENLSQNFLFHTGHMVFNLFSPNWQKSLLKNVPNCLKSSLLASLRAALFDNQYLKPFLPAHVTNTKSTTDTSQTSTTAKSPATTQTAATTQSTETTQTTKTTATSATRTITSDNTSPLTEKELTEYAKELWTLAADCLEAARCEEPDPALTLDAHTPKTTVPTDVKNARMRAAIKSHLPLFERLLSQPNFQEVLDQLCEKGKLPKTITQLLQEKVHKNGSSRSNVFDTARKILANLSPIMAESDKHGLVDQLPDADLEKLATDMNQMLSDIDPYEELPFYRDFSSQLSNSIKIKPVRIVAEQLTKHYFQALKHYPEFQRAISVAILRLGPFESNGKRIGAIAQTAGLGFQKSMQLFSRDIQDPEIREALEAMKQNVTPMPHEKVVNIIREELQTLSESNKSRFRFELAKNSDIGQVLKSATVGQVHPAILKVTDLALTPNDKNRTRTMKVALKVKRDGLAERCHQEEDGLRIALDKALTASMDSASKEGLGNEAFADAVKETISELFENIRREIDFKGTEFENSQAAKVLYNAEEGDVQLKSAACMAATDNLLIQEWAPGKSINEQWDTLSARAETEDNFTERLRFANGVNTALRLELAQWISAYVNGDACAGFYLDGDRHDGNGHYDPSSQTYTVFDFGAGLQLTPTQSRTLNKLTAAISTGSATATLHYLLKLMPESAKAKLTLEDKEGLKAQIKNHIRNPDDATRLNDMHAHLSDAGIWPEHLTQQAFSDKMDALGLRAQLLRGKSSKRCRLPTGKAERRTNAMITVLQACGVKPAKGQHFSAQETAAIAKAVNNEFQVLYTGVDMSTRITHQLTDDYHELFLVKTLARLAECFVDAGLPAPGIVLQLNRGAKMIGDKIEENNQRIAELRAERPLQFHSLRDQKSLKKLKPTDVGNVFMSALRPNFLQFMRYRVRSRFAPGWRADSH